MTWRSKIKKAKVETIINVLKEMDLEGRSTYSVGELNRIAEKANATMLEVMCAIRYGI